MPYETHPRFITPSDDTVLWRYLNLPRFLDIIERRVLWFARSDTLEDPLEGSFTDAELEYFRSLPDGVRDSHLNTIEDLQKTNFVCCWRAGTDESMAMWDIYKKGGAVLAIKSTIGQLKSAFASYDLPVYIGKVRHIDRQKAYWDNTFLRCMPGRLLHIGTRQKFVL